MSDQSTYGWIYKYDRKHRVWRALNTHGLEINQYSKEELFFVIDHLDPVTKKTLTLTRATPLTEKERKTFFLKEMPDEQST